MKNFLLFPVFLLSVIAATSSSAQDSLRMRLMYTERSYINSDHYEDFSISIQNHTMYTSNEPIIECFDVSNPANPMRLRDIHIGNSDAIWQIRIDSNEALVANCVIGKGRVYDLIEPDSFRYRGRIANPTHNVIELIKIDSLYYSFCGYHGFLVNDLHDTLSSNPLFQDTVLMNRKAERFGDFLFVAGSNNLNCYDVSCDTHPVWRYSFNYSRLFDFSIFDNRIAVSDSFSTYLYRIERNGQLQYERNVPTTAVAYENRLHGNLLFTLTQQRRIEIWSVVPNEPTELCGYYQYPNTFCYDDFGHFVIDGNTVFLRTWDKRYNFDFSEVVGVSEPGSTVLPLSVMLFYPYPNPFNSSLTCRFFLPKAGSGVIDVTDVTGRSVATLSQGTYTPGINQVQWNATGLSSGNYFVRLRTGNEAVTRPITLLK